MTPSKDLFNLIKSLSKSEKRYVALVLKQNSEKNYGKLFSVIAAQSSYDEEIIKRTYKNEPFVKQFRFTKNYLHNLILKHLRSYYSESSVITSILNKLIDVEILIEKGFYDQGYKRLKTLLVLSEEHELFHLQIVCQNILRRLYYMGVYEIPVQKIKQDEGNTLSLLSNLKEFSDFNLDVHVGNAQHGLYHNSKAVEADLKNIIKNKKKPISVTARYIYLNAILSYYGNKRNFNPVFWKALSDCDLLYKNNPDFAKKKPLLLVNYLRNRALTEILNNRMDEALVTIGKIESFDKSYKLPSSSQVKYKFFEAIATLKIEYYYETRQFDKIMIEAPVLLERLAYFEDQFVNKDIILKLRLSVAMLYFIDKQYKFAIKLLLSIVNDQSEVALYTKESARFILFVSHFELKNYDTFLYLLKVYSFNKRSIEYLVISFLQKVILEKMSRQKYLAEIDRLKRKIAAHKGLQNLKSVFDIFIWIDSKIQNTTYKKILANS